MPENGCKGKMMEQCARGAIIETLGGAGLGQGSFHVMGCLAFQSMNLQQAAFM